MDIIKENRNLLLANEIRDFVINNNLACDVRIYFNNTCYDWYDGKQYFDEPILINDIKASDYFEYANNDTVSMTFEGALYDILNNGASYRLQSEFEDIFERNNCYYELGNAWNLSVYFDND
jgi:hypothetical protein